MVADRNIGLPFSILIYGGLKERHKVKAFKGLLIAVPFGLLVWILFFYMLLTIQPHWLTELAEWFVSPK